jgi:beta-lactam-binding protein with PASTA domain
VDAEEDFFRPPAKSPVPAAVITSIITAAAMFFALRALDERGALPWAAKVKAAPDAVEVPSLLGMRREQAREVLQARDLLLVISVERESAQYLAGTIAEQTPLLGSQLPRGSAVQAVLSRGLTQVPVPKVTGLTAEDAVKQVAAVGLSAGLQKPVPSDAVPAGTVLETDPPAGTPLALRGSVALVVSSGAAGKPIPKLSGMRLRAARELLEQQGFKVGKIRRGSDDGWSSGVVLGQDPAPPAAAIPGTLVNLTVNED